MERPTCTTTPTADMQEYRRSLVALRQDAQVDYDKAILTLSGGALGISFAFFRDITGKLGTGHAGFLLAAWIFWHSASPPRLPPFIRASEHSKKPFSKLMKADSLMWIRQTLQRKLFNKFAGVLFVPVISASFPLSEPPLIYAKR